MTRAERDPSGDGLAAMGLSPLPTPGRVTDSDFRMPPLLVRLLLALVAALVVASVALAQTGTYNADTPADPATETRLKHLSEQLRCLVCQNQTIADSNADLAVDLRRMVRQQILDGKSDDEIKKYLVDRYGDFVLYKPPMQGNTAFLWIGPFALLGIGLVVWWLVGRRRPLAAEATAISVDDEQKAKSLLDGTDDLRA